jgi:hypothetical protein
LELPKNNATNRDAEEEVNLCSVRLPVAQSDLGFAIKAAEWMGCFYPGSAATVLNDHVELTGDAGADRLELIWCAALLNERLHAQNEILRRGLLAGLTQ